MQVQQRVASVSKTNSANGIARMSMGANSRAVVSALGPKVVSRSVVVEKARSVLQTRRATSAIVKAVAEAADTQGKTATPLPIVFVSAECAPWSKTGGLGDVVAGLPVELVKRGHQVISICPRYDQYYDAWDTSIVVNIDGQDVRFFHTFKQGVHRVWVDHPWFLAKVYGKTGSKLYGPKSGADFVDNHKRFSLFCKAAIEAVRALPFGFGEDCVFVANDWHSALVPVLLKDVYQPKAQFTNSKVALCIHNIAFQGRMWPDTFKDTGLPQSSYDKFAFEDGYNKVYTEVDPLADDEDAPGKLGMFKKVNWLKAGILAADQVVTVSPNYASEISQDASGGVELDSFIKKKGGAVGIVNGMDTEEWDPRVDKFLTIKYDKNTVYEGKAAAKELLQAETGLPVTPDAPLFAFIGRLEEQKGVDILLAAVPKILEKVPNAQIVLLGTGKAKLEKQVLALNKVAKGNYKGIVKFSAPLAHLITAGADYILVPSRFEPCGLIQLHAMAYGTVPVVSSTGGLVDTVKEGVTGFHMGVLDKDDLVEADVSALVSTAARAAEAFSTPLFKKMVYNCISQDLSWSKPAQKWEGVLEKLYLGLASGQVKADSIVKPIEEFIPGIRAATDKPVSTTKPINKPAPAPPAPAATSGPKPAAAPTAGARFASPAPVSRTAAAATTSAVPKPAAAPAASTATTTSTSTSTTSETASSNGAATATPATPTPVKKTLVSATSK